LTTGLAPGVYRALQTNPAIWVLIGAGMDQTLFPRWNDYLGVVVLDAAVAQRVPLVSGIPNKRIVMVSLVSVMLSGIPASWAALDNRYNLYVSLSPFNAAERGLFVMLAHYLGDSQNTPFPDSNGYTPVFGFSAVVPEGRGLEVSFIDTFLPDTDWTTALPLPGMVQVAVSGFRV